MITTRRKIRLTIPGFLMCSVVLAWSGQTLAQADQGQGGGAICSAFYDPADAKPLVSVTMKKPKVVSGDPSDDFLTGAIKILRKKQGSFGACFDKALSLDHDMVGGQVVVEIQVLATGKIGQVTLTENGVISSPVSECVVGHVRILTFPSPGLESTLLAVTLDFEVSRTPGKSKNDLPFLVQVAPLTHLEHIAGDGRIGMSLSGLASIGSVSVSPSLESSGCPISKTQVTEQAMVLSAIDGVMPALESCYASALTPKAKPSGRMLAQVTFGTKGKVTKVGISGDETRSKKLVKCVSVALKKMKVDPLDKGSTTWQVPLRFKPDRKGSWPLPSQVPVTATLAKDPTGLDAAAVQKALDAALPSLTGCFATSLGFDPDATEHHLLILDVSEGGVLGVSLGESAGPGAGCVQSAAGNLLIEGPSKGQATVVIELANTWFEKTPAIEPAAKKKKKKKEK